LTEKQLYFKLQDFGGYNQKFLANSIDEAALLFQDDFLVPDVELKIEKFNSTSSDKNEAEDLLKIPQILDDALEKNEIEETKVYIIFFKKL